MQTQITRTPILRNRMLSIYRYG